MTVRCVDKQFWGTGVCPCSLWRTNSIKCNLADRVVCEIEHTDNLYYQCLEETAINISRLQLAENSEDGVRDLITKARENLATAYSALYKASDLFYGNHIRKPGETKFTYLLEPLWSVHERLMMMLEEE